MGSWVALWVLDKKQQLDETGQCREGFVKEDKFKHSFEAEVYGPEKKKKEITYRNSLLVQWVKDPVLSLQWGGFDPWPRNFHMSQLWT